MFSIKILDKERKKYDDVNDRLRLLFGIVTVIIERNDLKILEEYDQKHISEFLKPFFKKDSQIVISPKEANQISTLYHNKIDILEINSSLINKLRIDKKVSIKSNKLKTVDLFCGAGGLSEGFRQSGFSLELAVDFDETALRTFRFNLPHKSNSVLNLDLSKNVNSVITKLKDKKIDVLIGGPPCQGFSVIGRVKRGTIEDRRNGFIDDPRNKLFKSFVKVIEAIKPKAFLMENVSAVRSASNYEELIIQSFKDSGYNVSSEIFNAGDFGIPQNRKRIFFIGFRKDFKISPKLAIFQIKKKSISQKNYLLKDALYNLPIVKPIDTKNSTYLEKKRFGCTVALRNNSLKPNCFLQHIGGESDLFVLNHKTRFQNERDIKIFGTLKPNEDSRADSIKNLMPYRKDIFFDKYFKLDPNKRSKTIVAHMRNDANSYIHPFDARTLTPREAARIQTFPDDYFFMGSTMSQFQQIGNSVPCKLSKIFAEVYKELLD